LKDVLREAGKGKMRTGELKKAFDEFDTDKSGTISREEMK
jgi:Ca2+-binding EF-hand superfamily protein